MADGTQFAPGRIYRAARASGSNPRFAPRRRTPQRRVVPSTYLASGGGAGRERRNRVCRGPPRRVAPYSPLGRRAWWPARCRRRSGEYVSVSSQQDSEKSLRDRGRRELPEMPAAELDELAAIYEAKGVSSQAAVQVAAELTAHDALAAHVDAELRLDPDDLATPPQGAAASAASITVGSLLPLLAIWLPPATFRLPVTFVAVLIALGWRVRSAHISEEPRRPRRAAGG